MWKIAYLLAVLLVTVGFPSFSGLAEEQKASEEGPKKVRWLDATRKRYTKELTTEQKVRFLARLSSRALDHHPDND